MRVSANNRFELQTAIHLRLFCRCRAAKKSNCDCGSLRWLYHFLVAALRAKKAECVAREGLGDYDGNLAASVSDIRAC